MKKPMLLSNDEYDLSTLDYDKNDWFVSIKRDGVRAEITNEGIKNRSLKILRNPKMQEYFKAVYSNLPDGVILEAEIYTDGIPCREMAGICNSKDKEIPQGTKLYIFGMYDKFYDFQERLTTLYAIKDKYLSGTRFEIVEQFQVGSYEEVMDYYNKFLEDSYEGAILMNGQSIYKEGRLTVKSEQGYKLKPHKEDDLKIIGITERMENLNESQKNELGQSYKRNTVDAKKGTGIAAAFICLMPDGKTETKVTITGTEDFRKEIWQNQDKYIGSYAVVKSMDYGTKDRLRHPRLLKVKDKVEK